MSSRSMASISRAFYRSGLATTALTKSTNVVHPLQWTVARQIGNRAIKTKSRFSGSTFLKSAAVGLVAGTAYAVYVSYKPKNSHMIHEEAEAFIIDRIPDVPIARKIVNKNDKTNLDLVLFQYQTCPFCCKVRAFLDYSGLTYSVVEVDSVLRQSIKWSPYKKVPSLLARRKDGTYVQLTESSTIISLLSTYLHDPSIDVGEWVKMYPVISYMDDDGHKKHDVMNKYFQMYGEKRPKSITNEMLDEERQWRSWIDQHFIHLISPNVYRTFSEALETFRWFAEAGEWDHLFPRWERNLMVGVGATAMYLISKRLKKRHGLDDDVRQHIYDACNKWTNELDRKKMPFMGGAKPNLADISFYGALTCMEGCKTFDDIRAHTKIDAWFEKMKKMVAANRGIVIHPVNAA